MTEIFVPPNLQAELDDRTAQLEGSLSQLEKAELKAAKEARQRLELERTLRRFKNPSVTSGATSHSALSPSEEAHHDRERDRERDHSRDAGSVRTNASGSRAGVSGAASAASARDRVPLASYARDRSAFDHSFDGNASVGSTSLAVEDLNDTTDLRLSHGARGSTATPQPMPPVSSSETGRCRSWCRCIAIRVPTCRSPSST